MNDETREAAREDEIAYLLDAMEPGPQYRMRNLAMPSEDIAIAIRAMHLDAVRSTPMMKEPANPRGTRQQPAADSKATALRHERQRAKSKAARKARRRG